MRFTSKLFAAALAVSIAATSFPASAIAPQPGSTFSSSFGRVSTGGSASTPLGFQIFCMKSPQHCNSSPSVQIQASQQVLDLLQRVNNQVNGSIHPQLRSTQTWELGARIGDCKDFAMNKWNKLQQMGVPAGALRLAIGFTAKGQGHAVLVVRTSQGDLVLDNLTSRILPISQVSHRLIAMSTNNPRRWTSVS